MVWIVATVMDMCAEVRAIARSIRIGTRRQTSSNDNTRMVFSFLAEGLPMPKDASLTIACPAITAETIDHSGMKKKVRNSPRYANVIPITMKGRITNKSSESALTLARLFFPFPSSDVGAGVCGEELMI